MRVLIQKRYASEARATDVSFSITDSSSTLPGFSVDQSYEPVRVPNQPQETVGYQEVVQYCSFNDELEASTYVIRGEVADENALASLTASVQHDDSVIGVYSDPEIGLFGVCPGQTTSVGNTQDVERLLDVKRLQTLRMDGSKVMVAIVDSGINLKYLKNKGKNPEFDASKSWCHITRPGDAEVGHGTMCAFNACIAAPKCTLLDYAIIPSKGNLKNLLSDAIKAFENLRQMYSNFPDPKPALIVSNSWGILNPRQDFPVGHDGNYSNNLKHPFNVKVGQLEKVGVDILFAAGNCGSECPFTGCLNYTNSAIYGANSHPSILSIAGVTVEKVRVGYSSKGPGRLYKKKPDLCAYTHFSGSGVNKVDFGTSAACPVASGVVAAIRTVYAPTEISPAELRDILRDTAVRLGQEEFDYSHGYGLLDVSSILNKIHRRDNL